MTSRFPPISRLPFGPDHHEHVEAEVVDLGDYLEEADTALGDLGLEVTDSSSRAASTTTSDLMNMSITHNRRRGRRYRYYFQAFYQLVAPSSGDNGVVEIADGSDSTLERIGQINDDTGGGGNAAGIFLTSYPEEETTNQEVTRKIRFWETTGADFRIRGDFSTTRFWVEDAGPT